MSNRKQRRTYKNYYKKEKQEPIKLSKELKDGIILFVVIGLLFVGAYFATKYLLNSGNLSTYEPSTARESVITYEDITCGMVFNRKQKEYYVAFEDFGDSNKVRYANIIKDYKSKEKHITIYKVDMTKKQNYDYKSTKSNSDVQKVKNLKINVPTLIKIKDGINVKYIEGIDKIESELLD